MAAPRHALRALAGALLLGLATQALAAPPATPAGAVAGAPGKPAAGDKCPVCGMFVARYPDWVAAAVFKDGQVAWFDGVKDLFKFLLRPDRYSPGRAPADVARVLVTDYYGLKLLDAREAWFVIGSDVFGPMGTELIPFALEADAKEFKADHKGTGLLRFSDVGPATLKQLQEPE